jgi:hypothetical protein
VAFERIGLLDVTGPLTVLWLGAELVLLLAASDLGLLDKNEKDTLTKALNLRNRCGHSKQ